MVYLANMIYLLNLLILANSLKYLGKVVIKHHPLTVKHLILWGWMEKKEKKFMNTVFKKMYILNRFVLQQYK